MLYPILIRDLRVNKIPSFGKVGASSVSPPKTGDFIFLQVPKGNSPCPWLTDKSCGVGWR